ncbi:MAG: hypothetical protein O3A19_05150 [Planctomycetota bacterium]|jgi:anti-sigma28 factor (negative regulator of flagellin synthesis)|nr:hypothetical protein [Planctomycetota bacterium]MDA1025796.1 hypothetical protein [Planctomycetota bacterium]
MSDIANIAGNLGSSTSRLQRAEQTQPTPRPASSAPDRFGRRNVDAVELSDQAQRYADLQPRGDAPTTQIARIQSEISHGNYDTDTRLDIAMNRMIDNALA